MHFYVSFEAELKGGTTQATLEEVSNCKVSVKVPVKSLEHGSQVRKRVNRIQAAKGLLILKLASRACFIRLHKRPQIALHALLDCFLHAIIDATEIGHMFHYCPVTFKCFRLVARTKYPSECQ